MIWGEKKKGGLVGAMSWVGGLLFHITGKCFMSKLECLRKKNCLNILFEINTFNKVCGDGVGLRWSEVDWRGKNARKGEGRIRLLSSSSKVYLNFICYKYRLVVLI